MKRLYRWSADWLADWADDYLDLRPSDPGFSWRRWSADWLLDVFPITNPVVVAKVGFGMFLIGGLTFAFGTPLVVPIEFFGSSGLLLALAFYLERKQERREHHDG